MEVEASSYSFDDVSFFCLYIFDWF